MVSLSRRNLLYAYLYIRRVAECTAHCRPHAASVPTLPVVNRTPPAFTALCSVSHDHASKPSMAIIELLHVAAGIDWNVSFWQVDHCRGAQQLAALQQRTLRSAERLWQLPAGCDPSAAVPADVERLAASGRLQVRCMWWHNSGGALRHCCNASCCNAIRKPAMTAC